MYYVLYRHQQLMQVYQRAAKRASSTTNGSDLAALQRHFQFLRDEDADNKRLGDWEMRMSVRYYRKLFREYALADLSRYEEAKIGLRWRTEMEVIAGKGQFSCGNKRCSETSGLHSYELLFAYVEQGEKKRCLVKVRVCEACAKKLFHKRLKEIEEKKQLKQKKQRRRQEQDKRKRRSSASPSSSSSSSSSCSDSESSADEEEAKAESSGATIHEICAKINREDLRSRAVAQVEATKSSDDQQPKKTTKKRKVDDDDHHHHDPLRDLLV